MRSLDELKAMFKHDTYATEVTGIEIDSASSERVVCSVDLDRRHKNGNGHIMGGVIYTLADFCFAVFANSDETKGATVTASSNISFLNAPRGNKLIAETYLVKGGSKLGFFETRVKDDLGTDVALVTTTGVNTGKPIKPIR